MKYIFLILIIIKSTFPQVNYSPDIKGFIDFDDSVIVLKNALLIDGKGGKPQLNQTVIIKNSLISWIGKNSEARISNEWKVLDLTGKSIMPGLIGLHEHLFISVSTPEISFIKQLPLSFPRLYLACGITTMRTASSLNPYSELGIKKEVDEGRMTGPEMFLTAPLIEGEVGNRFYQHKINKVEDVKTFIDYYSDLGFTSFKVYTNIKDSILNEVVKHAHQKGKKVLGHLCSITYKEAVEAGIDHLEHGFIPASDFFYEKEKNKCPDPASRHKSISELDLNSKLFKSLVATLIKNKISLTSTLAVYEGFTSNQPEPDPRIISILSNDQRELFLERQLKLRSEPLALTFSKAFPVAAKMEKKFYEEGGLLTVGTDPTGHGGIVAGYSTWRTIELLVELAGFSNLEAIQIATINGAKALGIENRTGSIEVNKEADLLIIDGDPSKNISDLSKVVWVVKDGVGFNSKKLFESMKGKVGIY